MLISVLPNGWPDFEACERSVLLLPIPPDFSSTTPTVDLILGDGQKKGCFDKGEKSFLTAEEGCHERAGYFPEYSANVPPLV